jgi:glucose/arabinose dehydrogenase
VRGRLSLLPVVVALLAAPAAHAATYPAGFEGRTIVSGLNQPTAVAFAPNGRTYVAEKAGRLKVVQPGGSTATTLLDIGDHVNGYADRGLLGLAVDADFASNGFVYLLYSYELQPLIADSNAPMVSRLTRIKLNPDGSLVNPGAPETVLLGSYASGPCPPAANTLDCIPSDGISHSIGTVRSAPDGTLYVGSGDAADFNIVDPLSYRTYDEQGFTGKVVHIDRNGNGLPGHSFCPADNDLTHVCTKLFAKGFRNPFRFSVRPGGAGLAVGDVGWNTWEELDLVRQGGGDYGWPCYEASTRTPGHRDSSECQSEYAREGTPSAALKPDHEYDHTLGSAIIGGPTYTGTSYPAEYRDNIFVGDYTGGFIRRLTIGADGRVNGVLDFASGWFGVDIEQDPSGNLVTVDIVNGTLERIAYTGGASAPIARIDADPTAGSTPLTVSFDAGDSTDPDGDPLTYSWDFGDGATATGQTASHTYPSAGTYTATLTARDPGGRTDTATVKINPGGHAPTVTIAAPAAGGTYRDGDVVQLSGSATDVEDGTLPASALQWRVRLHHSTHIHPITDINGVAQTSFTALRDHDADSFYDITLIATDADGLVTNKTVELRPQTVPLTLDSAPAGAPVSYGGRAFDAPTDVTTTIGYDTTVTAGSRFTAGSHAYVFDSWSDGGARSHTVRVPGSASTLRASYLEDYAWNGTASASSSEGVGLEAGKALDADPFTRWSSNRLDDQWWQVDLGATRQVSRVEIDWEAAYASTYRILTSTDGTTFTQAAQETTGAPGTKVTSFAARSARYVRVQSVTRATQYGISFYEARVLGPPVSGGDTTPPDTTITGGPNGSSASATASFSFTASESGSSFDCRLDGGAWTHCSSPFDYAGLADGQHAFSVRATDIAGNVDPSPATRVWSVATSTTGENLALNKTATASSSEFAGFGPQYAVDGNAGTRWSSTYADGQWWQVDLGSAQQVSRVEIDWEAAYASTYRILTSTDGTNFTAAADDNATGAGFEATAFAARSARYVRVQALTRGTQWGVSMFEVRVFGPAVGGDTTPPDTTITAGPSGTVSTGAASFEFSSNEQGSSFECRLDGGAWAGCTSPRTLANLADGSHSFDVRATDQAGNVDATPASRTWTVSTVVVAQDLAQGQPTSSSSIDGAGHEADKAVDGNAATRWSSNFSENQWWQVDLGAVKQVGRVELDWETAYAASYEILVSTDGTTFVQGAQATAPGPGPRSTTFAARSARYVRVRSLQRATQWGIAFFSARVYAPAAGADTTPPDTTITAGPSGTSTAISPSFQFTATEAGSSFQCRLDSGAWAGCTSPRTLANLADGSHSFDVRATDTAGNVDATPASRTWTVDAPYAARVLATTGLASFWRLGETTGTAAGDSKGTNAGTYTGGPTTIAGLLVGDTNAARNFDGVDDAVDLAPGPFGTPTQASAEAWVRIDQQKAAGGYHFLITDAETDLSDGFTLAIDSAGRPIFSVASTATTRATAQSSVTLTPNTVYHLVGTYDGASVRVYVNGTQRGSAAYTGGIGWRPNRDLLLARQNAATNRATRYLDGRLDEAAIYTTALSAATVAAHNAAGR